MTLALGCDLMPMPDDDDPMGSTSGDPSGEEAGSDPEADAGSAEGGDASDGSDESSGGEESGGDDGSTGPDADTPPELEITAPATDLPGELGPTYDGRDDELGLWYVDVDLAAMATDAEDGDLGEAVEWTTDQTGIQDAALGTGAEATVRLYSDDCFGADHVVTATVTDADGNSATAERLIHIWTLC